MINQRLFRDVLGAFATGVTVVTARKANGAPVGVTINSFSSVALTPPLVLFCLAQDARCYEAFADAHYFAVNILSDRQQKLSRHFAGTGSKQWGKVAYDQGDQGCPLLRGALGWIVCRKKKILAGGDHGIFLGQVTDLQMAPGKALPAPLLYYRGQYRRIKN
ncbi:MAG: flavin reductase [Alphaproteobacteria bacterium]|nr:flavin reductase [Alphaproteobacteria bacterium]